MTIHQFNSLGLPKMKETKATAVQPEAKLKEFEPTVNPEPSPPSLLFLVLIFGIMLSIVTGVILLVAGAMK